MAFANKYTGIFCCLVILLGMSACSNVDLSTTSPEGIDTVYNNMDGWMAPPNKGRSIFSSTNF
jgi:uncharacterized protein YceK